MSAKSDLTGQTFGRWTVESYAGKDWHSNDLYIAVVPVGRTKQSEETLFAEERAFLAAVCGANFWQNARESPVIQLSSGDSLILGSISSHLRGKTATVIAQLI